MLLIHSPVPWRRSGLAYAARRGRPRPSRTRRSEPRGGTSFGARAPSFESSARSLRIIAKFYHMSTFLRADKKYRKQMKNSFRHRCVRFFIIYVPGKSGIAYNCNVSVHETFLGMLKIEVIYTSTQMFCEFCDFLSDEIRMNHDSCYSILLPNVV